MVSMAEDGVVARFSTKGYTGVLGGVEIKRQLSEWFKSRYQLC